MSNIGDRMKDLTKILNSNALAAVAYQTFKKVTPIRHGYAKQHTILQGNQIQANYDYAAALNAGKSKQAPNGMTDPTIQAVRDYVSKKTGIKL